MNKGGNNSIIYLWLTSTVTERINTITLVKSKLSVKDFSAAEIASLTFFSTEEKGFDIRQKYSPNKLFFRF